MLSRSFQIFCQLRLFFMVIRNEFQFFLATNYTNYHEFYFK